MFHRNFLKVFYCPYYSYFTPIESEAGAVVHIDGKCKIMMGSNNYMGLTNHPEVKQAAIDAVKKYGSRYYKEFLFEIAANLS